ncbi:MAG TPA: glutathione S-transferase domain-containing protein [Burkholderiaceae bacterium]|nr:glutathione S-transferase domain-containing protein [Burkholderiaceae bacterium]
MAAPDEATLHARATDLRRRFEQLEAQLGKEPWSAGSAFGMVDAVFGPVFRYFDVFDELGEFGLWTDQPKLQAWRNALARRPSVTRAVSADYPVLLRAFVRARAGALGKRIEEASLAIA